MLRHCGYGPRSSHALELCVERRQAPSGDLMVLRELMRLLGHGCSRIATDGWRVHDGRVEVHLTIRQRQANLETGTIEMALVRIAFGYGGVD